MYWPVYVPFLVLAVRRRTRPLVSGAMLALAMTSPIGREARYALLAVSALVLILGYPYEKQPVKFWERSLNAMIAGTSLAIALGLYNLGRMEFILGISVPFLLLKNRVLASFGLLPASALYLVGEYRVPNNFKLAIFALVYLYSLNHTRKLLR